MDSWMRAHDHQTWLKFAFLQIYCCCSMMSTSLEVLLVRLKLKILRHLQNSEDSGGIRYGTGSRPELWRPFCDLFQFSPSCSTIKTPFSPPSMKFTLPSRDTQLVQQFSQHWPILTSPSPSWSRCEDPPKNNVRRLRVDDDDPRVKRLLEWCGAFFRLFVTIIMLSACCWCNGIDWLVWCVIKTERLFGGTDTNSAVYCVFFCWRCVWSAQRGHQCRMTDWLKMFQWCGTRRRSVVFSCFFFINRVCSDAIHY